ncbi:protein-disulfide reductase DsbD domain-containing protein [Thioclava sp. DLFJ4-1]|uniref:protein-disulfide reductase DsbD domain-containing protein n=1 Tax=Thioclava sp. DLFJ4-1 TaxID=1915313 RepID=UPI000995FE58|nr:protein-disulfide reductase DsbD domain-containing protein [Thioclava sp. DLFJ4-1]
MTRLLPVMGILLGCCPLGVAAQEAVAQIAAQEQVTPQDASMPALPTPPGLEQAQLRAGGKGANGTRMAALEIALAPGWKTYWRSPGDAGIPPQIQFTGSSNLASAVVHWPAPEVFLSSGMRTVGYHDGVVLPISVTPKDPGKPVQLEADVMIGICDNICVPVSLHLQTEITGDGKPDPKIQAALAREPRKIAPQTRCETEPMKDGVRLTARVDLPPAIGTENALLELASRPVWVSEADSHREGDTLVTSADFVPPDAKPFDLDPSDLRITVLSDRGAVEIMGCTE